MKDTMPSTKNNIEIILARAITALPAKVELTYVNYDDQLTVEQVQKLLTGDKDGVLEEINEWAVNNEEYEIDELLKRVLPDDDEREFIKEHDESMFRFREKCFERNGSNPFASLINNMDRVMVRFYILNDKGENVMEETDSWNWDATRREEEGKKLSTALGLQYASVFEEIDELTANAGGGELCVLGYVRIKPLADAVEYLLQNEKNRVNLTFADPHILVHDGTNGSGHDVKIKGQSVVISLEEKELRNSIMVLDAKGAGTGYSWSDDIASVHKSAYKCDPKIELF